MKYAVVGDQGMFGAEMKRYLVDRKVEVSGFNRSNLNLDLITLDDLAKLVSEFDVIVNAIAYTNVELAEAEKSEAFHANAYLASKLAHACAIAQVRLAHISTNYVFSGVSGAPYPVSSARDPRTTYGISKAVGEELIEESGVEFTIFRTAWLYGNYGHCFPKAIAEKIKSAGEVSVVNDQHGQPTWTWDLADQVYKYSSLSKSINYVHAVSSGQASWSEFASEILVSSELNRHGSVVPISSEDFPSNVDRPKRAVLDNSSRVVSPIGNWLERWHAAYPSLGL